MVVCIPILVFSLAQAEHLLIIEKGYKFLCDKCINMRYPIQIGKLRKHIPRVHKGVQILCY